MATLPPDPTQLPVRTVLGSALSERASRVQELLSAFWREPKIKRVHDLRVSSRRLLATLHLIEATGVPVGGGLERRVRRVLHQLAPARDAEVQLRALAQHPATHGDALRALRESEQAALRRARHALSRRRTRSLARRLSRLLERLGNGPGDASTDAACRAALMGELAKLHLQVGRRLGAAEDGEPARLHKARLALKRYRYALEGAAPLLPPRFLDLLPTCQALQDELGRAQDAVVLSKSVRALVAASPRDAELKSLLTQVEADCRRALTRAVATLQSSALSWPTATEAE